MLKSLGLWLVGITILSACNDYDKADLPEITAVSVTDYRDITLRPGY